MTIDRDAIAAARQEIVANRPDDVQAAMKVLFGHEAIGKGEQSRLMWYVLQLEDVAARRQCERDACQRDLAAANETVARLRTAITKYLSESYTECNTGSRYSRMYYRGEIAALEYIRAALTPDGVALGAAEEGETIC